MRDEDLLIKQRLDALLVLIISEQHRYQKHAKHNYLAAQTVSWISLILGDSAAILGLVPMEGIEKPLVGSLAAISTAMLTVSQKAGFQQKANWHYRKVDQMKALRAHLTFELPLQPKLEDIASVSSALSDLNIRA